MGKQKRDPSEILNALYMDCQNNPALTSPNKADREWLDAILASCENNKAVLAVIVTLLLKKIDAPKQDIRIHQQNMAGGFSARGYDQRHVTPFLRKNNFPFMTSGAGALTRSLEQAVPYDKNYTGRISPVRVKKAFLTGVDRTQKGDCQPQVALQYLLKGLIILRDRSQNINLIKPKNRSIDEAVGKISKHYQAHRRGMSRLPTLALYAAYVQMLKEVGKYQNWTLCELQAHQSADSRSGFWGDIQVNDENGNPVEAVEVKHGIKLNLSMAKACYDKIQKTRIKTYYLLSTDEKIEDAEAIREYATETYQNLGCQLIVNGICSSLRYYLRLLKGTDNFLANYVELVEKECDYSTKMEWQNLWQSAAEKTNDD